MWMKNMISWTFSAERSSNSIFTPPTTVRMRRAARLFRRRPSIWVRIMSSMITATVRRYPALQGFQVVSPPMAKHASIAILARYAFAPRPPLSTSINRRSDLTVQVLTTPTSNT